MTTGYRSAKHAAQGHGRAKSRSATVNDWAARYEPAPSVLALLRGIWGKRDLLERAEREKAWSFLQWIQRKALTPAQLDAAKRLGASVGVGFDDPAFDEPATAAPIQPWGPLPMRPPGR